MHKCERCIRYALLNVPNNVFNFAPFWLGDIFAGLNRLGSDILGMDILSQTNSFKPQGHFLF